MEAEKISRMEWNAALFYLYFDCIPCSSARQSRVENEAEKRVRDRVRFVAEKARDSNVPCAAFLRDLKARIRTIRSVDDAYTLFKDAKDDSGEPFRFSHLLDWVECDVDPLHAARFSVLKNYKSRGIRETEDIRKLALLSSLESLEAHPNRLLKESVLANIGRLPSRSNALPPSSHCTANIGDVATGRKWRNFVTYADSELYFFSEAISPDNSHVTVLRMLAAKVAVHFTKQLSIAVSGKCEDRALLVGSHASHTYIHGSDFDFLVFLSEGFHKAQLLAQFKAVSSETCALLSDDITFPPVSVAYHSSILRVSFQVSWQGKPFNVEFTLAHLEKGEEGYCYRMLDRWGNWDHLFPLGHHYFSTISRAPQGEPFDTLSCTSTETAKVKLIVAHDVFRAACRFLKYIFSSKAYAKDNKKLPWLKSYIIEYSLILTLSDLLNDQRNVNGGKRLTDSDHLDNLLSRFGLIVEKCSKALSSCNPPSPPLNHMEDIRDAFDFSAFNSDIVLAREGVFERSDGSMEGIFRLVFGAREEVSIASHGPFFVAISNLYSLAQLSYLYGSELRTIRNSARELSITHGGEIGERMREHYNAIPWPQDWETPLSAFGRHIEKEDWPEKDEYMELLARARQETEVVTLFNLVVLEELQTLFQLSNAGFIRATFPVLSFLWEHLQETMHSFSLFSFDTFRFSNFAVRVRYPHQYERHIQHWLRARFYFPCSSLETSGLTAHIVPASMGKEKAFIAQ